MSAEETCLPFFRNNPSPPPSFQNLHKIEEDTSGEGEDMDQELTTPGIPFTPRPYIIPPEISVTDEQGNVKSHIDFTRYVGSSPLQRRSKTFNTLQDAYSQNTSILPAQEMTNVHDTMATNGLFSNIGLLKRSLENIVAHHCTRKDADDIMRELQDVLQSRDINYELSPDHSIKLTHSDVQLRMEVKSGKDCSDLRFCHMAGDSGQSQQLCNELLQYMSL